MSVIKGGFQRAFQTFLYLLIFCCAGIILGIYSYFLAVQADRDRAIPEWQQAVEGMSGAAVLYTMFAVVLTCCLGGVAFFAFLGLVLDILFCGAMIAIAVLTRNGANSCSGFVNTPLGKGNVNEQGDFGPNGFGTGAGENITYSVTLYTACQLNTAAFAVSIAAAVLFLLTAIMQVLLVRHHKKEKRYGPSPDNNYTSGYGKKRFGFGRKNKDREAEMGAVGRPSHETGMTGTTVGAGGAAPIPPHDNYKEEGSVPINGVDYPNSQVPAPHGSHGGYYTAPTGTESANPYGYNTTNTSTNY